MQIIPISWQSVKHLQVCRNNISPTLLWSICKDIKSISLSLLVLTVRPQWPAIFTKGQATDTKFSSDVAYNAASSTNFYSVIAIESSLTYLCFNHPLLPQKIQTEQYMYRGHRTPLTQTIIHIKCCKVFTHYNLCSHTLIKDLIIAIMVLEIPNTIHLGTKS